MVLLCVLPSPSQNQLNLPNRFQNDDESAATTNTELTLSKFLGLECDEDRYLCVLEPKCIPLAYFCDGDNDCG